VAHVNNENPAFKHFTLTPLKLASLTHVVRSPPVIHRPSNFFFQRYKKIKVRTAFHISTLQKTLNFLNFGVNHIESEHKLISNRKLENTGFAITKTKSVGCRKLELKTGVANYSYKTVQANTHLFQSLKLSLCCDLLFVSLFMAESLCSTVINSGGRPCFIWCCGLHFCM